MVLELELRGKLGCNTGATRVQDTRVKTQGDGSFVSFRNFFRTQENHSFVFPVIFLYVCNQRHKRTVPLCLPVPMLHPRDPAPRSRTTPGWKVFGVFSLWGIPLGSVGKWKVESGRLKGWAEGMPLFELM